MFLKKRKALHHNARSRSARADTCTALTAVFGIVFVVSSVMSCERRDDAHAVHVLRIGILPDEHKERLVHRHKSLVDYLSARTDIPCELIIPNSYEDLLQLFHDREVDLVYFGGLTFVKARIADGAVPLVSRDVDRTFTSHALVRADCAARRLQDCRGMRLSFGSMLSTSGHLMPRHFLEERGIHPETFFKQVLYSGCHDRTALNVLNGVVDVGLVNPHIISSMYDKGLIARGQLRVLYETPQYADYVWAIQPYIASHTRRQIRNAFLSLSAAEPTHAKILANQRARAFLPVSDRSYRALAGVAQELNLLRSAE